MFIHLVGGIIRFAAFFSVFGVVYLVNGGPIHVVLFQWPAIVGQIAFFALSIFCYASFKAPHVDFEVQRWRTAGKVGLALSATVLPISNFVYGMGLADQGTEAVAHALGASSVPILTAVLIYCSFFPGITVRKTK